MPTIITAMISIVNRFTTYLSFIVFQTIGRLTMALASEEIIVTLPAKEAVILPCIAIVAAAAVVLALLAKPPNRPVASSP